MIQKILRLLNKKNNKNNKKLLLEQEKENICYLIKYIEAYGKYKVENESILYNYVYETPRYPEILFQNILVKLSECYSKSKIRLERKLCYEIEQNLFISLENSLFYNYAMEIKRDLRKEVTKIEKEIAEIY